MCTMHALQEYFSFWQSNHKPIVILTTSIIMIIIITMLMKENVRLLLVQTEIILFCQARVQVQGLSQISNKRPGPGA